jgi:hypothetical protein
MSGTTNARPTLGSQTNVSGLLVQYAANKVPISGNLSSCAAGVPTQLRMDLEFVFLEPAGVGRNTHRSTERHVGTRGWTWLVCKLLAPKVLI